MKVLIKRSSAKGPLNVALPDMRFLPFSARKKNFCYALMGVKKTVFIVPSVDRFRQFSSQRFNAKLAYLSSKIEEDTPTLRVHRLV
jgi:hypothetical protein